MREKSFTQNVLELSGGFFAAQLIGVVSYFFIVRIYEPDVFGMASVFFAITGILTVISCLGYELAIILPAKDEEAVNILSAAVLTAAFFAALTGILSHLFRFALSRVLNMPSLSSYAWLLGPFVFLGGVFLSLNYWTARMKLFGRISLMRMLFDGCSALGKIALGLLGFTGGGGLIGGGLSGSLASTIALFRLTWKDKGKIIARAARPRIAWATLKRYRKFPIFIPASVLLNNVSRHLPFFLLAYFFTPAIVGFFSLGVKLIQMPINLFGKSITQVFYQKAAGINRKGKTDKAAENIIKRLVALGILPFLTVTLIGREMFVLFFGQRWAEAGVYAQIMSPWMLVVFLSSPLSYLLVIGEKQSRLLFIDLILLLVRFTALLAGGLTGNARLALLLFASWGLITQLLVWAYFVFFAGVSFKRVFAILGGYFFLALPFLSLLALGKWVLKSNDLYLFLTAAFSFLLYFLLILRSDKELRQSLRKIVK